MSLEKELKINLSENLNHEALLNLVRTSTLISNLANKFFAHFEISDAQFNILMTLKSFEDGLSQRDLSEKLILTKSNMVGLIDRLEQKNLVQRKIDAEDRRFNRICLTEAGLEYLKSVEGNYFKEVDELINNLNDEEKRTLIESTQKLRYYLSKRLEQ